MSDQSRDQRFLKTLKIDEPVRKICIFAAVKFKSADHAFNDT